MSYLSEYINQNREIFSERDKPVSVRKIILGAFVELCKDAMNILNYVDKDGNFLYNVQAVYPFRTSLTRDVKDRNIVVAISPQSSQFISYPLEEIVTEVFTGDGSTREFMLKQKAKYIHMVFIDGEEVRRFDYFTPYPQKIEFHEPPENNAEIVVTYATNRYDKYIDGNLMIGDVVIDVISRRGELSQVLQLSETITDLVSLYRDELRKLSLNVLKPVRSRTSRYLERNVIVTSLIHVNWLELVVEDVTPISSVELPHENVKTDLEVIEW